MASEADGSDLRQCEAAADRAAWIQPNNEHAPLVDEATFFAVQGVRAGRPTQDGERRRYRLAEGGGVRGCVVAGWMRIGCTGGAGYRCRHGYTRATPRPEDAPRNVYVCEDHLLEALPGLLEGQGLIPDDAAGDVGEQLLRHGLEIVCTRSNRVLRRTALEEFADSEGSSGQMALILTT